LPRGQKFRLAVREIGLHGEGGLGEVECGFQQLGSGFLTFGVGLKSVWGCVRHLFLMFLIEEVQFVPNSYCIRVSGGTSKAKETFLGGPASKIMSVRV
jgi:hypothetical protein